MAVPPGTYVYLAENIKNDVSLPVIACNRINDPRIAERIIAEGRADFVGLARGLIADPELPSKAKGRQTGRIRKCIGCNQGCLDKVFSLQEVTCLVNARVGREKETRIDPADNPRKILVVGGGELQGWRRPEFPLCAGIKLLSGRKAADWEDRSIWPRPTGTRWLPGSYYLSD